MHLHKLKKSLTEMTPEEQLALIRKVRLNRRDALYGGGGGNGKKKKEVKT